MSYIHLNFTPNLTNNILLKDYLVTLPFIHLFKKKYLLYTYHVVNTLRSWGEVNKLALITILRKQTL